MRAIGRRKFLQAAALMGAASILGGGCTAAAESNETETANTETPAGGQGGKDDGTSAGASGVEAEAPAASIKPGEDWLTSDTTSMSVATFKMGLGQLDITKVGWKTSTLPGWIDQDGQLLYYSDIPFTAARNSQGNIVASVTSTEGNGGVYSYTLNQDGTSIAASSGLSYSYPFLEQEGFSDVVSATPIAICPPGNMATSSDPLKYISSYVLVRHSQTGFTSFDRWEIRGTDGGLLFEFEFDNAITDCQAYTDPSESLFYIEGERSEKSESGLTRYSSKIYHRITQKYLDYDQARAADLTDVFGDTYFLADCLVFGRAEEDEPPIASLIRYADAEVTDLKFSEFGDSAMHHYAHTIGTEQGGWVVLKAGYRTTAVIPSICSYSAENGTYHKLDTEYERRINWESEDISPCTRTVDGEHVILLLQGDDDLSYAAVFDMTWNLLFDPVRADAVLGEGHDGKFAVRIGDALSPATYVFYDLEGNELNTIEASEGIVLDADAAFDRTNQGVVTFERTGNPGVPCAIDLTGTVLFEGIDVSQAMQFVIEESEE